MRYLSDSEIIKWNDKLLATTHLSLISIAPRSSGYNNYHISIASNKNLYNQNTYGQNPYSNMVEIADPEIDFQFMFSVTSNRCDSFNELIELFLTEGFGTKSTKTSMDNTCILTDISLSKKSINNISESTHTLYNKEYTKYTYDFRDKLCNIIAYVTIIEDAISFFEKMWGYTEEGEEINLLPWKIGYFVSKKNNKSEDYIVIDYKFIRGDKLEIKYLISIIDSNIKSPIIKYGKTEIVSESELTWSRNDRIDSILN